jgi:omega-6 fatty acid desaturase (delta-12 desaturase)
MESTTKPNWRKIIRNYNKPNPSKSNWQIGSTMALYVACWFIAYEAYQISLWHCLGVAVIAQVFFGRLFIFMHDCGHGSFYKSKKARTFWGNVTGIIWFTPYEQWTKAHATHHRHSGDLSERGTGDIWTLTVDEYKDGSFGLKLFYRVCRWPIFVVFVGGLYTYFGSQRFFMKTDGPTQKKSVIFTNISIILMGIVISSITSFEFYAFYQFFLLYFGSTLAVFFFYVQHQYEDVYWANKQDWDYETAAIKGCSNLKVPRMIQWASGNIGFHHIHHLSHAIPNYNLEKAFKENEYFQNSTTLTLWDCVKTFNLALYDLEAKRMITFGEYSRNKASKPVDLTIELPGDERLNA